MNIDLNDLMGDEEIYFPKPKLSEKEFDDFFKVSLNRKEWNEFADSHYDINLENNKYEYTFYRRLLLDRIISLINKLKEMFYIEKNGDYFIDNDLDIISYTFDNYIIDYFNKKFNYFTQKHNTFFSVMKTNGEIFFYRKVIDKLELFICEYRIKN